MNKPLETIDPADVTKSAALVFAQGTDAMEKWSDEKKNDFCNVFEDRARASAWILVHTADKLLEVAERRQFVGCRAANKVQSDYDAVRKTVESYQKRVGEGYPYVMQIGGRSPEDLGAVAAERAEDIFKNLPPLRQAVSIIKPEVVKMIDELEVKKALVKKLSNELDKPEYNSSLRLSEVDQKMTIGDFRKMVKAKIQERKRLAERLNEAVKGARELDDTIAKALYAGIPELQDAILDVVKRHYERAQAMGGMTRRVQEHVKFGDSKAAVDMVKQFEADEAAVSPSIKAEFNQALERLKLSAPMVRKAAKQLKEKKS